MYIGEAFKVAVDRRILDGDLTKTVKVTVLLDGVAAYGLTFVKQAPMDHAVYHGWWTVADSSTGSARYRPFEFGAPGEDAVGNRFDDLRIEIELDHVVRANERTTLSGVNRFSLPSNMEKNQVKKPFQPNVTVGESEFKTGTKISEFKYKNVAGPLKMTVRYSTALGLELKKLISPSTHPQYFPDLNDDDDGDDDDEPWDKKKQQPPKKKVKQDPSSSSHGKVIDLTGGVKVKNEMPPRIDGDGLAGASRDDPIVLS